MRRAGARVVAAPVLATLTLARFPRSPSTGTRRTLGGPASVVAAVAAIFLLAVQVVLRHRSNIARLLGIGAAAVQIRREFPSFYAAANGSGTFRLDILAIAREANE